MTSNLELQLIYYFQLFDDILVMALPWLKVLGIMLIAMLVGLITCKLIRCAGRS